MRAATTPGKRGGRQVWLGAVVMLAACGASASPIGTDAAATPDGTAPGGADAGLPAAATYTPVVPFRVADTRHSWKLEAGESRCWKVAGNERVVPADAHAVSATLTAVRPSAKGFLTLYPYDSANSIAPTVAALNYPANGVIANGALAQIGDEGKVCLYSAQASHVVLDIAGYFATSVPG